MRTVGYLTNFWFRSNRLNASSGAVTSLLEVHRKLDNRYYNQTEVKQLCIGNHGIPHFNMRGSHAHVTLQALYHIQVMQSTMAVSRFPRPSQMEMTRPWRAVFMTICHRERRKRATQVNRPRHLSRGLRISWRPRRDSNPRPSAPEADALSSCATGTQWSYYTLSWCFIHHLNEGFTASWTAS